MTRAFNFGPGPAMLPQEVMAQAQREFLDWRGTGMSAMEMSHRGAFFMDIAAQAESDLRALLAVPAHYKILFLQGGAHSQFSMAPMNLLRGKKSADYANTGRWSQLAIAEAKRYCAVNVAASSEAGGFSFVPEAREWRLDPNAAFVHYVTNETVHGVEFHWVPETGGVTLVADMSSNILARQVDVSRYGLIYAGAQKNLGAAGLTVVIVREDLLGKTLEGTPTMFDYKVHADNQSMYNTPPTYALYLAGLVFRWVREKGGVAAMEAANIAKASVLYNAIDQSEGFYRNPVRTADRSRMNVVFFLKDEALNAPFLAQAESRRLLQLKGHMIMGGMRASIYNSMPLEGARELARFMEDFARKHE